MRLTLVLNRQHIGFMFKKHWIVQGKRVPIDTHVEEYLTAKGIKVEDALEFINKKPEEHQRYVSKCVVRLLASELVSLCLLLSFQYKHCWSLRTSPPT